MEEGQRLQLTLNKAIPGFVVLILVVMEEGQRLCEADDAIAMLS